MLNPNTGMLAYSNAPIRLAVDPGETYWENLRQVTLFVHDLATHSTRPIVASVARAFHPRWVNDATLEYDDPTGEGRVVRGITPAAAGRELAGLSMVDADHGWASDGARLYATQDGGQTWGAVGPDEGLEGATQLDFVPDRAGWAVCKGRLFKTTDGGRTWLERW